MKLSGCCEHMLLLLGSLPPPQYLGLPDCPLEDLRRYLMSIFQVGRESMPQVAVKMLRGAIQVPDGW